MNPARESASHAIHLKNHLDGTVLSDTLHQQASSSGTECSISYCSGSVVRPDKASGLRSTPPSTSHDEETLLREAEDFIAQYYTSLKRKDSFAHFTRWEEVRNQIVSSGTYQLKETELAFGAKTAWRNAARCIGRMFWNQLQVFDGRFVRTSQEIFQMLCDHLRFATNNGNIRSTITLFPPSVPNTPDFRIWNSQLISYAGYGTQNGIIGDPQNKSFTQICLDFGWISPSNQHGKFDILPWVIQVAGQEPVLFDVPKDIIMEVNITHPELSFLSDMHLKWYAVPCISNMKLQIGGLKFPACAFNGWYMDTEIACRDLCDENRYNVLPTIAAKLGLDCSRSSTMWKEKAQTEMIVAVIHSYQKAGVVMIDHHKACELFEDHLRNETKIRGGCPADWVWIVPPSATNLTVLFHQEMLNYKLLPSFEYQENAWDLENNALFLGKGTGFPAIVVHGVLDGPSTRENGKKLTFKGLVRIIIAGLYIMRKCIKRRTRVLILYGSQSGRSRRFASKLAQLFRQVFNVRLVGMDEYDANELRFETIVLVVSSTFGNGDPPAMGEEFSQQLFDLKMASLAAGAKALRRSNSFTGSSLFPSLWEKEPTSEKGLRMRVFYSNISDALPGDLSPFLQTIHPALSTVFDIIRPSMVYTSDTSSGSSFSTPERSPQVNGATEWSPNSRPVRSAPAKLNPNYINEEFPMINTCFSVFGLGSSAYPKFCGFAAFVNNIFGDLGAERLMSFKTGDELSDQEKAFQQWQQEIFEICTRRFDVQIRKALQLPHGHVQMSTLWSPSKFRGTPVKRKLVELPDSINVLSPGSRNLSQLLGGLSSLHHKNVQGALCLEVRQLLQPDAGRQILLIRLDISRCENFSYEPGDHVLVFPSNSKDIVSQILDRCIWDLGELSPSAANPFDIMMQLEPAIEGSPASTEWMDHNRLPGPLSVRFALTYFLDIAQAPSQSFLLELAQVLDPKHIHDREKLLLIATDSTAYAGWIAESYPTLLDTLQQFSNIKCPVSLLLTQLPLLEARYYSVSSSRKAFPRELHITADVIVFGRNDASGFPRLGLCSKFWTALKPGDIVPCATRVANHFRLPTVITTPIMLIGPGTGIAPFRSFWQELGAESVTSKAPLDIVLYFGCRRPDVDDFYAGELENAVVCGGLRKVYKAYSREAGKGRVYVQDLLRQNAQDVYRQCVTMGGHIYICGDVRMVTGVQNALLKIFQQEGGISEAEAKEYLVKMTEENRFHEDVFGLNSNEDSSNGI
ncbi:nitric oxide synthase, endothelial-like [Paramacrobiotus metropolitanus]|uniref:nitric oxide synthase, endothelial-like n=1 Tax=Paramacrobiotus metropolitanus TaxID=2943436 RepID=UPI002445FD94|nr:nitric oxide synthase, endothelial-like [Paramacrobiotus metropolitanus]